MFYLYKITVDKVVYNYYYLYNWKLLTTTRQFETHEYLTIDSRYMCLK